MRRLIPLGICLILFVSISFDTYSQNGVSFIFGSSIPVKEFASDDINSETSGGAAVGFNLGLRYLYEIKSSGLAVYSEIDINYNGLRKNVKNSFEDLFNIAGIEDAEIRYNKYLTTVGSFGIQYTLKGDEHLSFIINAGLTFSLFTITELFINTDSRWVRVRQDPATGSGYNVGCGLLINSKTSLTFCYYNLGNHEIESEVLTGSSTEIIKSDQKIELLTLKLGFKF